MMIRQDEAGTKQAHLNGHSDGDERNDTGQEDQQRDNVMG